jgi:hypothetical protein
MTTTVEQRRLEEAAGGRVEARRIVDPVIDGATRVHEGQPRSPRRIVASSSVGNHL